MVVGITGKAEQIWGKPVERKNLGEVAQKAVTHDGEGLTITGIQEIHGLTLTQLEGLESFDVIVSKGSVTEAELDKLLVLKEQKKQQFMKFFKGTKLSEKELADAFEKLWIAGAQGKLTNSKWDEVMAKHGFEMTSPAFDALFAGQDGFSDSDTVVGIAEFITAMDNLELTLQYYSRSEEEYTATIKELCQRRSFRVIYLSGFENATMDALKQMKPDFDFAGATYQDIFKAIKDDGTFGKELQALALNSSGWQELLVKMLAYMRQAVRSDISAKTSEELSMTQDKRMKYLGNIINGEEKDPEVWQSFTAELASVFSGKTYFSYDKVAKGEVKKEEVDYKKKNGGLEFMRQTVEKARLEKGGEG